MGTAGETGTEDSRLNPKAWEEFEVGEDGCLNSNMLGFLNSNIELGFEAKAEGVGV
jgi:hypothetical protein